MSLAIVELRPVEIEILTQIDYTENSLGHGLDWERILCRAHGGDVFEGLERIPTDVTTAYR